MAKHLVTTTVEVDAANPHEAAALAAGFLRRNPPSGYTIKDKANYTFHVQLQPDELRAAVDRM